MKSKLLMVMLCLFGSLAVVNAQIENFARSNIAGDTARLLAFKSVQEDLKMDDKQVTKVGEWAKGFVQRAIEIKKNKGLPLPGVADPTPEQHIELVEKMCVIMSEINNVTYEELGKILRKEQIERLKQITLQDIGVRAFLSDDVISALKLTDKQQSSLKQLRSDYQKTIYDTQRERTLGDRDISDKERLEKREKYNKEMRELGKKYLGKSIAILDDEQKRKWKEMTGEAFDLEKLRLPIQTGKN